MNPTKKLAWLGLIFTLSACQAVPLPNPLPTFVPSFLPGPVSTPTPTPVPSATPLPTVEPVVRIEAGDQALFFGDYDSARTEYQAAFNDSEDDAIKAAALWGLGRTALADGRYQQAVETLTNLTDTYSDSTYAARAYFLMGQAYYGLNQFQQAAEAYSTYMRRVPGALEGYVHEYRGDALYEAEDYTGAQNAYNAALNASRLDDGLDLQIKIAQARIDFGDYAGALTLYDQIFAATSDDYVKAQIDYLAGNAHIELGQTDQAYGRYLHAVENYPLSYYSYLALVELIDANIVVNDLDRGLVDYFAGQYDVALAAFDRYIDANPVNDGSVHYYRALTLRELQQTQEAIEELDNFIKVYSGHTRWVDAWSEKAFLEWSAQGDYEAAVKTLLEFVSTVPDSPAAAGMLVDAGRVLERDNRLEEAAQAWERVANEYPASEQVPLALFWAGIARYRLGDFPGALATFQRNLLLAFKPEDRARAYLWIGKTQQQLGDDESAQESWQQGQAIDPTEYYSLRARDLLLDREPFAPPAAPNLNPDLVKEREDAEAWVRVTFSLPPETDLTGPGALAQDARFIRGTELWELGMYDEARLEFESLREAVGSSAVESFRLANHLLDIGLYRPAIFAIRQVLTLAGHEDQAASLTAPPYFGHSRYGLYYHDLIIPEAQRQELDPLFLFSVVRQESLFEGFVRSTAGAHGLMQVIPSTGEQIARELNWPPAYSSDDLYRPIVSVRFGSYYLDKNRDLFDGGLYAGLAAYNAGPGNAVVWNELAGNDPDLLLEIIRFEETRNYIRLIYEIFNAYRTLYGPAT
ncbi:MAG TPA: tetratricopeptide repeat protein [Anaerolineales bacterium]|nr:tetratricopeptide repeat protein [Anaerolineales bacterium]